MIEGMKTMQDINKMSRKQLESFIRNKGKTANTRLTALQKSEYASSSKALSYVQKEAYYKPSRYSETKTGFIKFEIATTKLTKGKTTAQSMAVLRGQAKEIQNFLNAKSSTLKGIKNAYEKASQTLSETIGTNISAFDIGKLFKAFNESNISQDIGSDQIIKIYQEFIKNMSINDIINAISQTEGISLSDIKTDLKQSYFLNKYKGILDENVIKDIVEKSRQLSINAITNIFEDNLNEWNQAQDWNDV